MNPLQYHLDHFDVMLVPIRKWDIFIDVTPEAKQSVAVTKTGHTYTPRQVAAYVKCVADSVQRQWTGPKIRGCVRLTAIYSFEWRKLDRMWESLGWILRDVKPDVDNLHKPLADALIGICFADDACIVESRGRKVQSPIDCIALRIEEVRPMRPAKKS